MTEKKKSVRKPKLDYRIIEQTSSRVLIEVDDPLRRFVVAAAEMPVTSLEGLIEVGVNLSAFKPDIDIGAALRKVGIWSEEDILDNTKRRDLTRATLSISAEIARQLLVFAGGK